MCASEAAKSAAATSFPRRLGRGLCALLKNRGYLLLPASATVLTLCSTWIILGPVLNRSGDNIYHLMNEWAMRNGIWGGDNPLGPIGIELGQPVLRFYQGLFYLYNVGLNLVTGLDMRFLHNLTIVVCFGLSPFSYTYFLRKVGLGRWAAGLGGFLSMISVAAFGNSFEAYHQAGIVTQSIGGLFFPWFMGSFIGMLREENRPTTTAALFAVAFLSHAIMSVFAVFTGALYFAVARVELARVWRRLALFGVIGAALVAFWAVPFIEHTATMRPVPDSVIRGKGVHWFTSVSTAELSMVLASGRLLDDARRTGDERDANDKFMDKISIIGTLKTRPPVLTALTALGALIALLGIRRFPNRFLLSGLAFSLMLFAGPDDFRWLRFLPFMKQIQTFRCTYLVEFFAFGLAAVAVHSTLRFLLGVARSWRRDLPRRLSVGVWVLALCAGLGFVGAEILMLGQTHLRVRDSAFLDEMVDACGTLPKRGYPYRIAPKFTGRFKIRHAWLAKYGFAPYCTHWKGTGPTATYHLCNQLGSPKRNRPLFGMAGLRWFSGQGDPVSALVKAKDADGAAMLERWPNGKDRRKKGNSAHQLLDLGNQSFLRPYRARPLPVVCNDAQWIWLAKSWTSRYRNRLWSAALPMIMRVPSGTLGASGLLPSADAVLYLDHEGLDGDAGALARYARNGGVVISPAPIDGVETASTEGRLLWDLLPETMRPTGSPNADDDADELDPGLEAAEIAMLTPPRLTQQRFWFDVDAIEDVVVVLPMENAPGWTLEMDGASADVFSTGPNLVGARVPAGAHRLAFAWEMPTRHRAALWLSLLATAAVLLSWAATAIRRARGGR